MALKWMSDVQKVANFQADVVVDTNGQRLVSWGKSYVRGMDMLLVTRNGVEQAIDRSFVEYDDYNIQFIEDYLEKDDEVRVYYIPTTLSLGDIRVVGSSTELASIIDAQYNEIALCIQDKKFFICKGNRWEEFILPFSSQNVGTMFSYERITITDPTVRTITFQNLVYSMNANAILVFVDGKLVDPVLYEEVDSRTITFLQDLPIDLTDTIHDLEVVAGSTDSWEDSHNHNTTYLYNPDDSISTELVTVGANTIRTTTFLYDEGGNITKEITAKNGKVITKDYSYDVKGNITGVIVTISS
jgi:hypothetical protein